MNFFDQRVIFSDNGTLKDITPEINSYLSGTVTLPIVAAEDAIYIGSVWPWSNRYFEVGTVNALPSSVSVSFWDGQWRAGVDLIDLTSVSNATLAQSGIIRVLKNRQNGWSNVERSDYIPELSGTTIYDLYWAKITFSADLSASTSLKYIGLLFSGDEDLYRAFPDLNQPALKTLFKSGKTDWKEQGFEASRAILMDLKSRNFVCSQDQVLEPEDFRMACVYKTAQIIYGGLGKAYFELSAAAGEKYSSEMNLRAKYIDVTLDGQLSRGERTIRQGRLVR